MAKRKLEEPRVPLPGENPKKAPKRSETKRNAFALSEEIVVESETDSDSGDSGNQSDAADLPSNQNNQTKVPKPQNVKRTEPLSPPVESDQDDGDEDEDEDEEQSETEGSDRAVPTGNVQSGANGPSRKSLETTRRSNASQNESPQRPR
jgi:hypothetical protein